MLECCIALSSRRQPPSRGRFTVCRNFLSDEWGSRLVKWQINSVGRDKPRCPALRSLTSQSRDQRTCACWRSRKAPQLSADHCTGGNPLQHARVVRRSRVTQPAMQTTLLGNPGRFLPQQPRARVRTHSQGPGPAGRSPRLAVKIRWSDPRAALRAGDTARERETASIRSIVRGEERPSLHLRQA